MEYRNSVADTYRYPGMYETAYAPVPQNGGFDPVALSSSSHRLHPYMGNGHFPLDGFHTLPQKYSDQGLYYTNPPTDQSRGDANPHTVKTESASETAEILDLDSYKVHVYQPPGTTTTNVGVNPGPILVPTPPYTPAASVSSNSNSSSMGWMTPTPPLPPLIPPSQHDNQVQGDINSFNGYDIPSQIHHNQPATHRAGQGVVPNPAGWKSSSVTSPIRSAASPAVGPDGRRLKTYNCDVCSKWFTSSGHLKRHYNTTLHKNAIKNSGATSHETNKTVMNNVLNKVIPSPAMSDEQSLEYKPELGSAFGSDDTDTYHPPPKIVPHQSSTFPQQTMNVSQPQMVNNGDQYNPPFQTSSYYGYQQQPTQNAPFYVGHHPPQQQGVYSLGYYPNQSSVGADPSSITYDNPQYGNNNYSGRQDDGEQYKMDPSEDGSLSDLSGENGDEADDKSDAEGENSSDKTTGAKGSTKSADGYGSFKCTQCDKVFNRVCYLTQHNNTFHKGDKPFKCHMCGKRFQNADLFSQHQQKHAGDKPYKCSLCPKQFNHKTDLRRHMCLHTGQKPFLCQICNKGFIRKDHMVKHVQTHTRRNAAAANHPA